MGEVHRIHPRNYDQVNVIAGRVGDLALRLSFLSKIAGWDERKLDVTDLEYRATMEALAKEAQAITEQTADLL